jgi:flagellar hook-basal body complex protein FliE
MHELDGMGKIGPIGGMEELGRAARPAPSGQRASFAAALGEAIRSVDQVQRESEAAQSAFAAGKEIELHDVLVKVEEADLAFRTMMEVRNKLVEAYREVMRLGAGG